MTVIRSWIGGMYIVQEFMPLDMNMISLDFSFLCQSQKRGGTLSHKAHAYLLRSYQHFSSV